MAKFLKPDNTISMGGVLVNYYPLTAHNPNKIAMPGISMSGNIIGVTIHNTGWINTAANTTPAEQYTRATVNGAMKDVRVHYYVDHKCAWQNLPLTLSGWHAADGSGNGNRRTIAIECIMSGAYNDIDKASEDNAARLAAELLRTYGLSVDNLYTHTHWLNVRDGRKGTVDQLNTMKHPYKMCPLYILPHWQEFKAKVAAYMGNETDVTVKKSETASSPSKNVTDNAFIVRVICDELNVRKGAGVEFPVSVVVHQGEAFTITETAKASDGGIWGRLKSGAGWINIGSDYCKRL